jgi:hypothetical protein
MRATAAQALARAGLDWWRIQLFLRWGSKAILGYVQEAPLASSASIAGEVTQKLALSDLERSMVDRELSLSCKDLRKIRTIVSDLMEAKFAAMPPSEVLDPSQVKAECAQDVSKALEAPAVSSEGRELQHVRNGHPASLVVHVVRSASHAACGWEYAKSPWHQFVSGERARLMRCRACRNALS